jgi:hypothetical protein
MKIVKARNSYSILTMPNGALHVASGFKAPRMPASAGNLHITVRSTFSTVNARTIAARLWKVN